MSEKNIKLVIAEKPSVAQSIAKVSVDATIVADHIVLEAENLGLSSCWLTVVNAPRTKVIRESAVSEVDSVTLVKGDVCIFTAGNQLSADAILAEGCVRVNEAMVTGESDEVYC